MNQPIQYQMPRIVGEARLKTTVSRIWAKSPQPTAIKVKQERSCAVAESPVGSLQTTEEALYADKYDV